jgi:hypothetical protein
MKIENRVTGSLHALVGVNISDHGLIQANISSALIGVFNQVG